MATSTQHFVYHYNAAQNVHELTFLKSSRRAVDEFIEALNQIDDMLAERSTQTLTHFWVDIRQSGVPPVIYTSQAIRNWMAQAKHRCKTRVAVLYADALLVTIIANMAMLLTQRSHDELKFFTRYEDEKAQVWLLADNARQI